MSGLCDSECMKKGTAKAVLIEVPAWKCSICGTAMPLVRGEKPPVRCSNRKECGAVFHQEDVNSIKNGRNGKQKS